MKNRLTLNQIHLMAWMASAVCAVVICFFVIISMSYSNYSASVDSEIQDFKEKTQKVFRRIEAELAVDNAAAVPALSQMFEDQLGIKSIYLSKLLPGGCSPETECIIHDSGLVTGAKLIQTKHGSHVLVAESSLPSFWSEFSLGSFWWVVFAIALLSVTAILIQRAITQKYVVNPISQLVDQSLQNKETSDYYPLEIQQLADDLNASFEARDKALFGQLAGGVIHDLRTLVHSVFSAVQLVDESADNADRKEQALELLYQASKTNIPKVHSIIETTLDGSREITIDDWETNLVSTIQSAIEESQEAATKSAVRVLFEPESEVSFSHDTVQLGRAFSNLIRNAIEAFDEKSIKGEKTVRVLLKEETSLVKIIIEDSGEGLKETGPRVFRFSQTTKNHGSGLGLLITKKVIDAHGGTISAEKSDDLGGARFVITLSKTSDGGVA